MSDDKDDLTLGQHLAMQKIGELTNHMIGHGLAHAQGCQMIATSIDEDHLPMNSAHFRAAGLHILESVEQIVKGIEFDDEDEDTKESLSDLQKEIDTCRAELAS